MYKNLCIKKANNIFMGRLINKNTILKINEEFKKAEFLKQKISLDVNIYWSNLKSYILAILDLHSPMKVIKMKPKLIPWYDNELSKHTKHRAKLYRRAIKSKDEKSKWSEFIKQRQICQQLFRKKKAEYFNEFINNNTLNSRNVWSKFKPYLTPNAKSSGYIQLSHNGTTHETPNEVAECFANFFTNLPVDEFNFPNFQISNNYLNSNFNNLI